MLNLTDSWFSRLSLLCKTSIAFFLGGGDSVLSFLLFIYQVNLVHLSYAITCYVVCCSFAKILTVLISFLFPFIKTVNTIINMYLNFYRSQDGVVMTWLLAR